MGASQPAEQGEPGDQGFVVPDDASELEPDRQAWLSEQRTLRRRARARRLIFTRRWERFGLSGPIVVLCLLVTGAVGALAIVFIPRPAPFPIAQPLSTAAVLTIPAVSTVTATSAPSPQVDVRGLVLPHATLTADAPTTDIAGVTRDTVDLQELRPALLLLIPTDCACAATVGALYIQAREFQLTTWYLSADIADVPGAPRRLARLDADAGAGGARWAVDPEASAARAVAARGLTAVLVRADGVVTAVVRDISADAARVPALELDLAQLPHRSG
jgi:hypothetical protein